MYAAVFSRSHTPRFISVRVSWIVSIAKLRFQQLQQSQIQTFLKIRHVQEQQKDESRKWILCSHITLNVRISCKKRNDWKIQRFARSVVRIHLSPVTDTPVSNKMFVNCQTGLRCHIKEEIREGFPHSVSIDWTFLILSEDCVCLPILRVQIPPGIWLLEVSHSQRQVHFIRWTEGFTGIRHEYRKNIQQQLPATTHTNSVTTSRAGFIRK
jgi:hypothetical protein